MNNIIKEIIDAQTPDPIATLNGKNVYTFADAQQINKQAVAEEKLMGKHGVVIRDFDEMGRCRRTACDAVAINPEKYFENRVKRVEVYKENGKPEVLFEVVIDYRAIKEQTTGNIYTNTIPVYVVGKQGKGIMVREIKAISDAEFVRDFKDKLDLESIVQVMNAIDRSKERFGSNAKSLDFEVKTLSNPQDSDSEAKKEEK